MNKLKENEVEEFHKSKITKLLNEMRRLPNELREIKYEPKSLDKLDTIQDRFQKLNHRLEFLLMQRHYRLAYYEFISTSGDIFNFLRFIYEHFNLDKVFYDFIDTNNKKLHNSSRNIYNFFEELALDKNIEGKTMIDIDNTMNEKIAKYQHIVITIYNSIYDLLPPFKIKEEKDTLKWINDILQEPFFKMKEYIDHFYDEHPTFK
jgi:hypothetical protein